MSNHERERKEAAATAPPAAISTTAAAPAQARIVGLQKTAGNRAVTQRVTRVAVPKRDQMRHDVDSAIRVGAYEEAAVILNGFDAPDLTDVLRGLLPSDLPKLRAASLVAMPGWSDPVVHAIDPLLAAAAEIDRVRRLSEAVDNAVVIGNWKDAAIRLNGFDDYDIAMKLAVLSSDTIERIGHAAPSWAYRVTRIAQAMTPRQTARPTKRPSAGLPASGQLTVQIAGASTLIPFGGTGLDIGKGPLNAPGVGSQPIELPGLKGGYRHTPFIEPKPQIPARAPAPTGAPAPAVDPLPAGATAEVRLASALGRITFAQAVNVVAVPLMLGAAGWHDTDVEKMSRGVRIRIVDSVQKIVNEQNRRMAEAMRKLDFTLIREKAPGLFNAALRLAVPETLGIAIALLKLAYGIALEKLVADVIKQDSYLSQYLKYVAGPRRADFEGIAGTVMEHLNIDVTTQRDTDPHKDPEKRPTYGENLIVIPYLPPWAEDSW
jgi:hypothetical protein